MQLRAMLTAPWMQRIEDLSVIATYQYDKVLTEDSLILMPVPWHIVPDAMMLLDMWGFPYVTTPFVWDYVVHDSKPTVDMTYCHTMPIIMGGRGSYRCGLRTPMVPAEETDHVIRVKGEPTSLPRALINKLGRVLDENRLLIAHRGLPRMPGWTMYRHGDFDMQDITIRRYAPKKRPWLWTFNNPNRL